MNKLISLLESQNEMLKSMIGFKTHSENIPSQQPVEDITDGHTIKTKTGNYINYQNIERTAFCLGCRQMDSYNKLLYSSANDTYYHPHCIPDNIKI